MKNLKETIKEAENNKTAVGHFNVSDIAGLKAVFEVARELQLPIIMGVSEGERDFVGTKQIVALIKSLREEYNYPVFLNADHTKSLEKIKEVVAAGFDAVMFDGSEFSFEENIQKTKEAVEYAKSINSEILVEGELGYIGGSSTMLRTSDVQSIDVNFRTSDVQKLIKEGDLTKSEEAVRFIKETGVDLLAPAVGNLHGIVVSGNPRLNIERIKQLKAVSPVPLVLHGGSGIPDNEISAAIDAGISIIHINTELRLAWRKGMEKTLKEKQDEIAPCNLLPVVIGEIKKIVEKKLKLFNKITQK